MHFQLQAERPKEQGAEEADGDGGLSSFLHHAFAYFFSPAEQNSDVCEKVGKTSER